MWTVGDRVKTPMPVNAPKGSGRVTSQVGTVTAVRNGLTEVKMDGSEMKVTWRDDTLTAEEK